MPRPQASWGNYSTGISFASDIATFEQAPAVRAVFRELGHSFQSAEEARNHLRRSQAGIKALTGGNQGSQGRPDFYPRMELPRCARISPQRCCKISGATKARAWVPRGYIVVWAPGMTSIIKAAGHSLLTLPASTSPCWRREHDEHYPSSSGFEAFSKLSSRVKRLMVMDATYTGYMYKDFQPDLEAFFDQHFRGKKLPEEPPTVRMPLPNTEHREMFLEAGVDTGVGHMSARLPGQKKGVVEYSADVQAGAKKLPMAVFESAPLDEELELVGHFRATLWVSSTTSDADIFVALRVMDGERPWHAHRHGDAQPLVPDEVVKIDVEIMPATGRVQKGYRPRVEISPAEGPGYPPGWERDYEASYPRSATNRIFTGASFPGSIALPVVPHQNS
ncbi:hypothetical protein TARUN_5204 [Trichoderma arundinaceum]|uniref:Xaa-Pro dipeptidyl-peptidase C-terminal domain-containing protein n=1 Tax=Trichoderma arundinaceum TaxID=490622 RepID=A0A395NLQ4_TRIAR|nr:hypothetical protein TARUN_5204 [Trichoderma arundinaceum]